MPPATPNITLNATAQDLFGAVVGSSANRSKLRITLCGAGPQLPRIAGTAMLAKVGPTDIESTNGIFETLLWGNDQITPSGTYYAIALVDGQGNVVQSSLYQITGDPGTVVDLSNLTPLLVPAYVIPTGYVKLVGVSGAIALNGGGWAGPLITFDVGLAGDVTAITIGGLARGQLVQFIVRQDATGARAWPWPAIVKNPPLINPDAHSVSTSNFITDDSGNLYPANGWS